MFDTDTDTDSDSEPEMTKEKHQILNTIICQSKTL
jgi:hypothetical protein